MPFVQTDYIPRTDALLDEWLRNFVDLVVADPYLYAVTPSEAAQLQAQYNDWHAAWTLAIDPGTRTKPTVAAKDAIRAQTVAMFRAIAQRIKRNAGVDTDDIVELGIHLDDLSKTPRFAPTTQPILSFIAATPYEWTLRIADSAQPNQRGQPFGSVGALLVAKISTTESDDPDDAVYRGIVTRNPCAVSWEPGDVGKVGTLWAAWLGVRGDKGPWSTSLSMHIMGG